MNNEELIKENIDLREKVFYLKMKCNCFTSISIFKSKIVNILIHHFYRNVFRHHKY